MPRYRTASLALWLLCCCALSSGTGCCARRGYLLHGDWSLELNRVPWRDDNCGGGAGCAAGSGGEGDYAAGGAVDVGAPPRARFHPVPTRNVFTPGMEAEAVPAPAPIENQQSSHQVPTQNLQPRYARKAKSSKCPVQGVCQTAANVVAAEPEPMLADEPQPVVTAKPKARLTTAWKAASRR